MHFVYLYIARWVRSIGDRVIECAVQGAGVQRAQLSPANWFAPPVSIRSRSNIRLRYSEAGRFLMMHRHRGRCSHPNRSRSNGSYKYRLTCGCCGRPLLKQDGEASQNQLRMAALIFCFQAQWLPGLIFPRERIARCRLLYPCYVFSQYVQGAYISCP